MRRSAVRVKDIMSRPVYTVRSADPIERAAALLADRQITAAPVLDGDGELVGMVSEVICCGTGSRPT
jgi:CBS domain-containing protein